MLHPDRLDAPLHWRKPRRVFVNSMSDLFHEQVPDEFIARVFAVMARCPQHVFQILTKRPDRMLAFCKSEAHWWGNKAGIAGREDYGKPLPNVHLGVSVENQHWADERVPLLLQTPAAVRFISVEPLLGPVDLRTLDWSGEYLRKWLALRDALSDSSDRAVIEEIIATVQRDRGGSPPILDALTGYRTDGEDEVGDPGDPRIDWVICGGESGPKRRPMDLEWARSLRDQCRAAGVPFFMKQASALRPGTPSGDAELDGCKEVPG